MESRGGRGEDADRAAHNGGGGGVNTTAGTALVVASGAEVLFEGVVRPWQAGDVVAVEEAGPVAGTDFEVVRHRRLEGTRSRLLIRHHGKQLLDGASDLAARLLVRVLQQLRHAMNPA